MSTVVLKDMFSSFKNVVFFISYDMIFLKKTLKGEKMKNSEDLKKWIEDKVETLEAGETIHQPVQIPVVQYIFLLYYL